MWTDFLKQHGRSAEASVQLKLDDEVATERLGQALALFLEQGDCLAFEGDLGVGKTHLTAALVRALAMPDEVASPTFTLVMEHEGQGKRLVHMDLYRLEDEQSFIEAGLEDYFDGRSILVLEWARRIPKLLPRASLLLEMTYDEDFQTRLVSFYVPLERAEALGVALRTKGLVT